MAVLPFAQMTRARRRALIDEFGSLQRKIDAFKPTKDRHAELRETIASWYDKSPADQPFLEEGIQFTLQVGPCTNERKITNMQKLFKLLGVETFLKLCKFPLAAVDASVNKTQHSEFLEETATGPRQIKVIAKATPAPAAKVAA